MSPADTVREGAPIHNAADLRNNERRRCIAWLHRRADEMNDQHAKDVLNSAAFSLGARDHAAELPLAASQPAPVSGFREAMRTSTTASLTEAASALSEHIERYHDHEEVSDERENLRGIQHHLEGAALMRVLSAIPTASSASNIQLGAEKPIKIIRQVHSLLTDMPIEMNWRLACIQLLDAALAQAPEADKARAELISALDDMLDYYEPGLTEPEVFEVEAEVLRNARVILDRYTVKATLDKSS